MGCFDENDIEQSHALTIQMGKVLASKELFVNSECKWNLDQIENSFFKQFHTILVDEK